MIKRILAILFLLCMVARAQYTVTVNSSGQIVAPVTPTQFKIANNIGGGAGYGVVVSNYTGTPAGIGWYTNLVQNVVVLLVTNTSGGGSSTNYFTLAGTNIVVVSATGATGTTNTVSVGSGVITNNWAGNMNINGTLTVGTIAGVSNFPPNQSVLLLASPNCIGPNGCEYLSTDGIIDNTFWTNTPSLKFVYITNLARVWAAIPNSHRRTRVIMLTDGTVTGRDANGNWTYDPNVVGPGGITNLIQILWTNYQTLVMVYTTMGGNTAAGNQGSDTTHIYNDYWNEASNGAGLYIACDLAQGSNITYISTFFSQLNQSAFNFVATNTSTLLSTNGLVGPFSVFPVICTGANLNSNQIGSGGVFSSMPNFEYFTVPGIFCGTLTLTNYLTNEFSQFMVPLSSPLQTCLYHHQLWEGNPAGTNYVSWQRITASFGSIYISADADPYFTNVNAGGPWGTQGAIAALTSVFQSQTLNTRLLDTYADGGNTCSTLTYSNAANGLYITALPLTAGPYSGWTLVGLINNAPVNQTITCAASNFFGDPSKQYYCEELYSGNFMSNWYGSFTMSINQGVNLVLVSPAQSTYPDAYSFANEYHSGTNQYYLQAGSTLQLINGFSEFLIGYPGSVYVYNQLLLENGGGGAVGAIVGAAAGTYMSNVALTNITAGNISNLVVDGALTVTPTVSGASNSYLGGNVSAFTGTFSNGIQLGNLGGVAQMQINGTNATSGQGLLAGANGAVYFGPISGSGTVTSVAVATDSAGVISSWSGSPITSSGTFTPTFAPQLQAFLTFIETGGPGVPTNSSATTTPSWSWTQIGGGGGGGGGISLNNGQGSNTVLFEPTTTNLLNIGSFTNTNGTIRLVGSSTNIETTNGSGINSNGVAVYTNINGQITNISTTLLGPLVINPTAQLNTALVVNGDNNGDRILTIIPHSGLLPTYVNANGSWVVGNSVAASQVTTTNQGTGVGLIGEGNAITNLNASALATGTIPFSSLSSLAGAGTNGNVLTTSGTALSFASVGGASFSFNANQFSGSATTTNVLIGALFTNPIVTSPTTISPWTNISANLVGSSTNEINGNRRTNWNGAGVVTESLDTNGNFYTLGTASIAGGVTSLTFSSQAGGFSVNSASYVTAPGETVNVGGTTNQTALGFVGNAANLTNMPAASMTGTVTNSIMPYGTNPPATFVLTANGGSAPPTYQAASGGGGGSSTFLASQFGGNVGNGTNLLAGAPTTNLVMNSSTNTNGVTFTDLSLVLWWNNGVNAISNVLSISTNQDLLLGYNAGNTNLATNATAGTNLFIGFQAGLKTTNGGYENTVVGNQSFGSNTTGFQNVAVGFQSLQSNTTAQGNVAVGIFALQENTTGTFNTAVGYNSFSTYAQTLGSEVGLGSGSGQNMNGKENTAVGANAMKGASSGSDYGQDNSALGQGALQVLTTGSYNLGAGYLALNSQTTGSNNVALGGNSLVNSTTASNNTAVGFYAGSSVGTLAIHNVYLGDYAASNGTSTRITGTNNIIMGYLSGSAFTGNESSNIDIGSIGVAGDQNTMRLGSVPGQSLAGGVTNLVTAGGFFFGQITNGTTNTACAFNVYYTNSFFRRCFYTLTFTAADQVATGVTIQAYPFETNGGGYVRQPIPWGIPAGIVANVPGTIQFYLGPGGYFAVTNTLGTATFTTNEVCGQ